MRIGIVADIHESVDALAGALAGFRSRGVDLVVSLGDACDPFGSAGRAAEVVELLDAAGAVGVWGNHDAGMCVDVTERTRGQTDPRVLEYMSGMQPQLVVAGCRFSHVEPWVDARRVEDLWYVDGPPDTPEKAARSFAAVPEMHLFIGHFHHWLVMTPSGRIDWDGQQELTPAAGTRHLIVVAPVVGGWCAIFDTESRRLVPLRCADGSGIAPRAGPR